MRIGLYGGSFNPIHEGHVSVAKHAINQLKLDLLIFIPCYKSTDKNLDSYVNAEHRINMINLILFDKCVISRYEVDRKEAVESIETIRYFKNKYPSDNLFFIIGSDNLLTIDTWQEYKEIDKLLNLVVFRRKCSCDYFDSKGLKILFMDNDFWNISSSEIRKTKNFGDLDKKVEEYIYKNNLYGIKI